MTKQKVKVKIMKPHFTVIVTQLLCGTFYLALASKDYTKEPNLLECENGTMLSQNICLPSSYLEGEVSVHSALSIWEINFENL